MKVRKLRQFRRKQKHPVKRKVWIFAALLVSAAFFLWVIPYTMKAYQMRRRIEAEIASGKNVGAAQLSKDAGQDYIEIDGKKYRRNPSVHAILLLGVDTSGEMEQYQASGYAGQADGIVLAAQDVTRDTVQFLLIPRDTMTEITLFDLMGNELGKDIQHLTLAFAYGDGREKSCELMRDAVSNLLCGLEIDHYLAMNTSSIARLNDAVGGVEVTISDKELVNADPAFIEGSTLTLKGQQAETFLRYRNINQPQTAISRLTRQKQYMVNYIGTTKEAAKRDDGLVTGLVDIVEQHMVTDMSKDQYMDMALAVLNSGQEVAAGDFITVPGETADTGEFDEYHPDKEALTEIVAAMFYREER